MGKSGVSVAVRKTGLVLLTVCMLICSLTGCLKNKQWAYYQVQDNYVTVTGTVCHMKYNDEETALYLAFEDMTVTFSDNHFKLEGENLTLTRERGIDEKVAIGDVVTFISAPRYFGDGYVMPIVAIETDDTVLLTFDEGYENLMALLS